MSSSPLDPGAGGSGLAAVEVLNLGGREWPAENGHAVLPRLLADKCQPLDVLEVLDVELQVFPHGGRLPAVEVVQLKQDTDLPELPDQPLGFGNKLLVVDFRKFSTCLHNEDLAVCLFL